jgi:hypothetical protein
VVNGRETDEALINLLAQPLIEASYRDDLTIPPPVARHLAAHNASGEILFFFDDHIIPSRDLFARGLDLVGKGRAVFFPYRTGFGYDYFHSVLEPSITRCDYSRWPAKQNPYPIAAAPHAGWSIRRDDFLRVGYGNWYQGFGGEEVYFCLSAWLVGVECWMEPRAHYWHYSVRSEVRGYRKELNDFNFAEGRRLLTERGILSTLAEMKADGVAGLEKLR